MQSDTGMTSPALASKPALCAGGADVLRAYDLIDQSRTYSELGPQAIQLKEIQAYLDIAKIDTVEDRLLFLNTIKTLDVIQLNHYAEQHRHE